MRMLKSAFSKLLAANLSPNFAKCTYIVLRQKFLGMVVGSTGV